MGCPTDVIGAQDTRLSSQKRRQGAASFFAEMLMSISIGPLRLIDRARQAGAPNGLMNSFGGLAPSDIIGQFHHGR
jgi:hypothetical protein